ncbi:MAG: valine--tRNA ligase [Puniceicoccales bacterium]|jgi:valyl-tRNA synthetase|nr:valine--tRNA ligase [Puniceicoccales bacterium]
MPENVSHEIPKTYEPQAVEAHWYQRWIDADCFRAVLDAARPERAFAIMMPPPNVTGVLHMGHLLNNTIQDVLVRRARQKGMAALWLPGTDHAGIATQSRVEKELRKNGVTRHTLGREKFVAAVADWRDKHGGIILDQLKKLGASCDWSRKIHTLDPDYSQSVLQTFVTLYQRGYIYRGRRMVNWCPVSLTGLSDEEVIMKPQRSVFYRMRYEIVEHPNEFVEIGTTRPETIPGDTAVAVNPADTRYAHLIGKHVWRPFPRAKIPIVADPLVEKDFGSGVLKVTPAHDKVDFEIGRRHKLEVLDVMNPDGTMNALAGDDLAGLDRFDARTVAAEKLRSLGLLIKEEPYENNVGYSERADVPVEPRLSEQWFIRYPKVEEAKRAVTEGVICLHPERWKKVYLHWLNNVQDWCISRQLWWGHRIPVWYKKDADRNDPAACHVAIEPPADPENWEQDTDVLDTWASSWLWCLSTLGWQKPGDTTPELNFWYPTSVLVTAPEIIFLWVARMIIAGLEFHGPEKNTLTDAEIRARIPFQNVYFNGIVRDTQGRKMSKSLGNSPEPLDLIARFGADGIRLGLLSIAPKGQDILFDEERIAPGRNFCNKLWNAARFRQMSGGKNTTPATSLAALAARINPALCDANDHAILSALAAATDTINTAFDAFDFNTYTATLHQFFRTDFCDWHIEVSKARIQNDATRDTALAVYDICLRQFLLLLHPVAPFISEELFHLLGYCGENDFIQNICPDSGESILQTLATHGVTIDQCAVADTSVLREFITTARALKSRQNLGARKDSRLILTPKDTHAQAFASARSDMIKKLVGASELIFSDPPTDNNPATPTPLGTLTLDTTGNIDTAAEKKRLSNELQRLDNLIAASNTKLANPAFLAKAPPAILAGARAQLADLLSRRDELARLLASMNRPPSPEGTTAP